MTSTSESCASPDLFDDLNMEVDEATLVAMEEGSSFTNVRFRDQMRFSCSGKVEDARQVLRECADFVRNEVKDTEVKCHGSISPPLVAPCRMPSDLFCYPVALDQLSLKQEDLEAFFNLLRMSLYELESMCGTAEQRTLFVRDTKSNEAEDLRRQISALLAYLTESISAFCQDITTSSKEILKNLMTEVKGVLLQIGRIHQLPFFGFSLAKGGHPYYHTCLDVWYAALKILALVQRSWRENLPCVRVAEYLANDIDDVTRYSSLEQLVDILLSDLISLAALRFSDELPLTDDCWCFTCPCIVKVWSLVLHFSDVTSRETNGESFWSRLHKAFRRFFAEGRDTSTRTLYSDRFALPCELRKSIDLSAFFWRLLRCLSCFYTDCASSPTPSADIRSMIEFLASKTVVPLLGNNFNRSTTTEFTHTMQMETKLRFLLSQYLVVFTAFEIQSSSIVPLELWQYYQKRLGFTFCSQEIGELLVVYESASEWLEKLRRLARSSSVDAGSDRRNSFELFLAIVVTHCSNGDAGSRLWTQMKGRILSKLTARRFQEFSECAMFNCLRLLLIVADCFEIELISDYVLDFFSEIPLQCAKSGVSKQKIVWQALSVAILIHQERHSSMDVVRGICQYLASSVNSVYQAYTRKKNDVVVRRDLWQLLSYFFKLLQELSQGVEGKDGLMPVLRLWTMDFYQIFIEGKECGDVRGQQRLDYLSAVAEILEQVSKISESEWQRIEYDERQKWSSVVRDRLIRSVRLHLHHWPWSEELGDAWYNFIVVSVVRADFRLSAVALFNEFVNVSTPNLDTDILCRFLSKLLGRPDVWPRRPSQEGLASQEEATALITKAWLRCLFVSPQSTSSISEIAKFVSESAPWRDLLEEYYRSGACQEVTKIGGSYGHCQLFRDICLALEMRSVTNPAEKPKLASLCQKTFSVPVRKLTKILTNADPLDVYTHCTRLLALLVEYCAPLIHHRDASESLLREIIALTVCNVGADNTPMVVKRRRVDMAAECLVRILRGLVKCDWSQNEVLKKQILECYRIELMRLAHDRKNVIMDASPLVVVLKETFSADAATATASTPMENLRQLLLKDVRVFVANRYANDKQVASASVAFVRSLVERTRSASLLEHEADYILWFCLCVWLLHDDRALVSDCGELIDLCRTKLEGRRSLTSLLTQGFTQVAMERWQQLGWSKVLGLATQVIKRYPMAKNDLSACVDKVTEDVKKSTGSGADMQMTAALHYFAAEISIL